MFPTLSMFDYYVGDERIQSVLGQAPVPNGLKLAFGKGKK